MACHLELTGRLPNREPPLDRIHRIIRFRIEQYLRMSRFLVDRIDEFLEK